MKVYQGYRLHSNIILFSLYSRHNMTDHHNAPVKFIPSPAASSSKTSPESPDAAATRCSWGGCRYG